MTQILTGLALWLHALGTVILIGYFLLLQLVFMPVLAKKDLSILSEISKRSRFWLYTALVIFMITGVYLTFVDPNYLGIGNFNNLWAVLMLVKHFLILVMLATGFWFNAILRLGQMLVSNSGTDLAIRRFRLYVNLMAVTGILVLLLTAIAQVD